MRRFRPENAYFTDALVLGQSPTDDGFRMRGVNIAMDYVFYSFASGFLRKTPDHRTKPIAYFGIFLDGRIKHHVGYAVLPGCDRLQMWWAFPLSAPLLPSGTRHENKV